MDFQGFVNTFSDACAVLSVQKTPDGHCGEIRILKANDVYCEKMGVARFHEGMLYYELVPKDSKFEDFCYRAAVLKKKMHAYVQTRGLNGWTDITLLPLNVEDKNLAYCAFFFESTRDVEPEKMSDVSIDTARLIIKSGITLRQSPNFLDGIYSVVSDIQETAEAFCCTILKIDHEQRNYSVVCEKLRDNRHHFKDFCSELSYEVIETWEKTIGKSNGIIIKDNFDMEELAKVNSAWVYTLKRDHVESLLLFPLFKFNKIIGYIFVTNFNTEKTVELKELIELISYFISAELTNHGIISELETISSEDVLTGVKNRSAMNQRVDRFVSGEETIDHPFGVIFADVNGLEQMNEDSGHNYGDKILKKAANLLKEMFDEKDEIYRARGDEFVIITPACHEEDFQRKVNELKERTKYGSEVCLSVGSHWNEEGKKLRRSMHIADDEMYNEKAKFYIEHQNLERRRKNGAHQNSIEVL